jgi:hypothetical protein
MAMPSDQDDPSADQVAGAGSAQPPSQPVPPQMPPPPQMPTFPAQAQPASPPPLPMSPPQPSDEAAEPIAASSPPSPDDANPASDGSSAPESESGPAVVEPMPRSASAASGEAPQQPGVDDGSPGDAPPVASTPATEADWLDRICPYLLSEDGSYRSTQPDESHRCTAQDPPGSLPMAFQERFCLTDRHTRCEMHKYAQSTRAAALEQGGVPVEQVKSARFKPAVRSVPLAMGPSDGDNGGGKSRRPVALAAAGVGGFILFIIVVVLLSGGGGGGDAVPAASGSPDPQASEAVAATPDPTPTATPEPQQTLEPGTTPGPSVVPVVVEQLIQYEVQEGEALLKIADNFGTTRRRIIRVNEGMADRTPYTLVGDVIIVPASLELSVEQLESVPGYLGPAE